MIYLRLRREAGTEWPPARRSVSREDGSPEGRDLRLGSVAPKRSKGGCATARSGAAGRAPQCPY